MLHKSFSGSKVHPEKALSARDLQPGHLRPAFCTSVPEVPISDENINFAPRSTLVWSHSLPRSVNTGGLFRCLSLRHLLSFGYLANAFRNCRRRTSFMPENCILPRGIRLHYSLTISMTPGSDLFILPASVVKFRVRQPTLNIYEQIRRKEAIILIGRKLLNCLTASAIP